MPQQQMQGRRMSSSTQMDISRNPHVKSYDTIIAAGGVEAATFAGSSLATAAFIGTRVNDIAWSFGTFAISFLVAGASREDSWVRDASLGTLSGSAAVLALRMMGKLNLFQGQQ